MPGGTKNLRHTPRGLVTLLSNAFDCRNDDRVERKYYYNVIARPLGLHNHFVSPSVRPLPVSENVHNSRTTMHGIYLSHFAYMCMSTFPYHSHAKPPFLFIYLRPKVTLHCYHIYLFWVLVSGILNVFNSY